MPIHRRTAHSIVARVFLTALAIGAPGAAILAQDDAAPATAPAESPAPTTERALTREEKLYLLDVQQAKLALDQAENEMNKAATELEDMRKLFDEKLITITKLNETIQKHQEGILKHRQAKIDLEKKRLEFLKNATLITVVDATRSRNENGEVVATVVLSNESDIYKARIAMSTGKDAESGGGEKLSDDQLKALLKVDKVIVTIKGTTQLASADGEGRPGLSVTAIVGDPLQKTVTDLEQGQKVSLTFRLVKRDIENVTICLEFLGTTKEYDVFLKNESSQDLPDVTSTQYAQIGQLGKKIRYDLNLERLAKTEQGFSLLALNLPDEIPYAFLDPSSDANLTQVKFSERVSKLNLYFQVSIPEKLDPKWVDANITFYILVTRPAELKRIYELHKNYPDGVIPPEEIVKLRASRLELTLIPRGVGKLDILIPNRFQEVQQGKPVTIRFNVLNSGTLRLRRVTPKLDLPLGWEGEVVPLEAELIRGDEKVTFTASVRPPEDVGVGEYAVTLKVEGQSGVERIEAQEKDFTVKIVAEGSITGTVILVTVLVVLVLAIAVASIKISRR